MTWRDGGLTSTRYVSSWLTLLSARGISPEQVLAGTGLLANDLQSPGWVSQRDVERAFENGLQLTGDAGLGLALGLSLNLSSHGALGFAGLTAQNTRDAVRQMLHYLPLITSLVGIVLEEDDVNGLCRLVVTPLPGLSPPTGAAMAQIVLGSFFRMADYMLGGPNRDARLHLAVPRNEQILRYVDEPDRHRILFEAPRHLIEFPLVLLEQELALADEHGREQAIRLCEEEMAELKRRRGLSGHVHFLLLGEGPPFPGQEQMACRLGMSGRTLHRRLHEEGTSYRELLLRVRMALARQCLAAGEEVTAIAHKLGYQDAANFTRAFRREEGMAPSAYRRQLLTAGTGKASHRHIQDDMAD